MKRIGLLTSGGDCQALNATMRGVVKALANNLEELEVYGFINGYRGMIYGDYRLLTSKDFSGILTKGGTILGSSRTPFKEIRDPDEKGDVYNGLLLLPNLDKLFDKGYISFNTNGQVIYSKYLSMDDNP